MKLYYAPGACSLAVHIVLREAGYEFILERVDLKTKKTGCGKDFSLINEKSSVPFLALDGNLSISETSVILQYLADRKPEFELAPKPGTFERVRLNEWLNFLAAEVHKSFHPFFEEMGEYAQEVYGKKLDRNFTYIASKLQAKFYLTGKYTVADAYLYILLTWIVSLKINLSAWAVLSEYMKRIESRPKVQEARRAEGLSKTAIM